MFEMQFNFIYMEKIEGMDKLEVSRTLMDSKDIELFEQESIQVIIDYKWNTYGRDFFLAKFLVYFVFLVFYFMDLATLDSVDEDGERNKSWIFWISKGVCSLINLAFFCYELVQMKNDRLEYFLDSWNYLELGGNILYQTGALMDILNERVTDVNRLVISGSVIFTLAKVVYLIRVFR